VETYKNKRLCTTVHFYRLKEDLSKSRHTYRLYSTKYLFKQFLHREKYFDRMDLSIWRWIVVIIYFISTKKSFSSLLRSIVSLRLRISEIDSMPGSVKVMKTQRKLLRMITIVFSSFKDSDCRFSSTLQWTHLRQYTCVASSQSRCALLQPHMQVQAQVHDERRDERGRREDKFSLSEWNLLGRKWFHYRAPKWVTPLLSVRWIRHKLLRGCNRVTPSSCSLKYLKGSPDD